ncbi:MAG: DNA-3-methyladenine glycosylase 2 family protein [Myxococcota bacterium]
MGRHLRSLPHAPEHLRRPPWRIMGAGDPTTFWRESRRRDGARTGDLLHASWTPEGPVTMRFFMHKDTVHAEAYGDGARYGLEHAEGLLGDRDDGTWAQGTPFDRMVREHGSPAIPTLLSVADIVLRLVFGQRVTDREANRGYRGLVYRYGAPAPGPAGDALWLPPRGKTVAQIPYFEWHRWGVEKKRAITMQHVGKHGAYLESCAGADDFAARLERVPGIGPWTSINAAANFGDADAAPTGDYNYPNQVAWHLAGEPRADDARMLELLEPYRPHRQRVLRLIETRLGAAPRYGPRMAPSRWTKDERY